MARKQSTKSGHERTEKPQHATKGSLPGEGLAVTSRPVEALIPYALIPLLFPKFLVLRTTGDHAASATDLDGTFGE